MLDLHKVLTIGQNSMVSKVVQRSDTTAEYASHLKDLLATSSCIHMAIEAAINTVDKFLPDDFVSVGTSIRFVHTAPTSLGMTVTVRTSIVAIEEHAIIMDIKAWDEQGDIGYGEHHRAIVAKETILKKAEERTRFMSNQQLPENLR